MAGFGAADTPAINSLELKINEKRLLLLQMLVLVLWYYCSESSRACLTRKVLDRCFGHRVNGSNKANIAGWKTSALEAARTLAALVAGLGLTALRAASEALLRK